MGFFAISGSKFSLKAHGVSSNEFLIQPRVTSFSSSLPTVGHIVLRHSKSLPKWMGVRMAPGVEAVKELIRVGVQLTLARRRSWIISAMPRPTALP